MQCILDVLEVKILPNNQIVARPSKQPISRKTIFRCPAMLDNICCHTPMSHPNQSAVKEKSFIIVCHAFPCRPSHLSCMAYQNRVLVPHKGLIAPTVKLLRVGL